MSVSEQDPNRAYRETQSQIYKLQETLLNSARTKNKQEEGQESNTHSFPEQYMHYQNGRNSAYDLPNVSSQSVLAFTEKHYPNKLKTWVHFITIVSKKGLLMKTPQVTQTGTVFHTTFMTTLFHHRSFQLSLFKISTILQR
ncbi:CFF_collapsed_G0008060.mRNA.1.CDS.1 [Saccharomyces cerevisiae]|nr:CFF_collapsed_G0008060.mRNA.1.CDS.1 [Saccharomyces cerevisiae]